MAVSSSAAAGRPATRWSPDCAAYGIYGQNDSGTAVGGQTTSPNGTGVYGQNDGGGVGVAGTSNRPGAIGVLAQAIGDNGTALWCQGGDANTALHVEGKAEFSRSGRKMIAAGKLSAVVTLADVTMASLVLVSAQQHVPGFQVESVVPHNGSFTIWLNRLAPTGGLKVAWFVID